MRTLKTLAEKGRTIVVTIHQPRSEIWGLFDHLVLLSQGSPLYSGRADWCLPYFELQGHSLPTFVNPAEFIIDLAAVDTRTEVLETTSAARVYTLKSHWKDSALFDSSVEKGAVQPQVPVLRIRNSSKSRSGMNRQIIVLTLRTLKVTYRDPMGMAGSLLEATSMAILTGYVFPEPRLPLLYRFRVVTI